MKLCHTWTPEDLAWKKITATQTVVLGSVFIVPGVIYATT